MAAEGVGAEGDAGGNGGSSSGGGGGGTGVVDISSLSRGVGQGAASHNAPFLLDIKRKTTDWTEQWPVSCESVWLG